MAINGKRNAGKTTLLFKISTTPGILDYNNFMIYSKTIVQYLYQFIEHGFKNNLKKKMINDLSTAFENDDRLEEDVEEMCFIAARDSENIEKQNPITIRLSININAIKQTRFTVFKYIIVN